MNDENKPQMTDEEAKRYREIMERCGFHDCFMSTWLICECKGYPSEHELITLNYN